MPFAGLFVQLPEVIPHLRAELQAEPLQVFVFGALLDEETVVLVAILSLLDRLPGDDVVELRGEVSLDLARCETRGLRDLCDLVAHLRRVRSENERQHGETQQRDDDEHNRHDRRPGAVRTYAPDASPFRDSLCHDPPWTQNSKCSNMLAFAFRA